MVPQAVASRKRAAAAAVDADLCEEYRAEYGSQYDEEQSRDSVDSATGRNVAQARARYFQAMKSEEADDDDDLDHNSRNSADIAAGQCSGRADEDVWNGVGMRVGEEASCYAGNVQVRKLVDGTVHRVPSGSKYTGCKVWPRDVIEKRGMELAACYGCDVVEVQSHPMLLVRPPVPFAHVPTDVIRDPHERLHVLEAYLRVCIASSTVPLLEWLGYAVAAEDYDEAMTGIEYDEQSDAEALERRRRPLRGRLSAPEEQARRERMTRMFMHPALSGVNYGAVAVVVCNWEGDWWSLSAKVITELLLYAGYCITPEHADYRQQEAVKVGRKDRRRGAEARAIAAAATQTAQLTMESIMTRKNTVELLSRDHTKAYAPLLPPFMVPTAARTLLPEETMTGRLRLPPARNKKTKRILPIDEYLDVFYDYMDSIHRDNHWVRLPSSQAMLPKSPTQSFAYWHEFRTTGAQPHNDEFERLSCDATGHIAQTYCSAEPDDDGDGDVDVVGLDATGNDARALAEANRYVYHRAMGLLAEEEAKPPRRRDSPVETIEVAVDPVALSSYWQRNGPHSALVWAARRYILETQEPALVCEMARTDAGWDSGVWAARLAAVPSGTGKHGDVRHRAVAVAVTRTAASRWLKVYDLLFKWVENHSGAAEVADACADLAAHAPHVLTAVAITAAAT